MFSFYLIDRPSTLQVDYTFTRTKHIDIQYHYIRDQVKQKRVNIQYVPTKLQLADFLTKNVRREIFEDLKNLANLFNYLNDRLGLGYTPSKPTILVDNKAAIKLAENPEFHKRTKHIDIQYHYIRDQVKQERVDIQYVPTKL